MNLNTPHELAFRPQSMMRVVFGRRLREERCFQRGADFLLGSEITVLGVRVGRQGTKKTGRNGETNKKKKESAMEAKLTKYERVPEEEIVEKPAPVHYQQQHEEFSTNLCDCCLDYETCCTGCIAPSLLHAQNTTRLEGQEKFLPACCEFGWALYGSFYLNAGLFYLTFGLCNFLPLVTFKNRIK